MKLICKKYFFARSIGIIFLALTSTNCGGVMVGASSSLGLAAFEERSLKTLSNDLAIATQLRLNLLNAKKEFTIGVSIEVFESQVLMTGALENDNLIAEAIQIAWKIKGVKKVINEIQLKDINIKDFTGDVLITTKMSSKITLDRDIFAINYKIATVNGIMYLIGLAQSQKELKKVFNHAKNIRGVNKIISHVRIKRANL